MHHAFIDMYSDINSRVHRCDPRLKIILFIYLIVCIVTTAPQKYPSFLLYAFLIMSLILIAHLPVVALIKRCMIIIPFVFLIALSVPFMKQGVPVLTFNVLTIPVSVTQEGLEMFAGVIIKAFLSILVMSVLISTSHFTDLLKAFQRLKVPDIIITILSFMYRYIFVLIDELHKMKIAKESRTVGRNILFQWKAFAHMLGVLFVRSYERSESVYCAMCARGFQGHIVTINESAITFRDTMSMIIIVSIITGIKLLT